MIFTIPDELQKVCLEFAEQRAKGSEALYRLRGEESYKKMIEDIKVGAMAEFAVQLYLREKGKPCTDPDLTLYETARKSFAPDLQSGDAVIHVKSQTVASAAKYGASWMFQKEDKLLELPSENGYFAFCLVDGSKVEIKAIVSVLELVEAGLIGEPKVPRYKATKRTIYLNDVLNGGIDLWKL